MYIERNTLPLLYTAHTRTHKREKRDGATSIWFDQQERNKRFDGNKKEKKKKTNKKEERELGFEERERERDRKRKRRTTRKKKKKTRKSNGSTVPAWTKGRRI